MVFTSNVFISTSKEAIDKVFFPRMKIASSNYSFGGLTEEEVKKSIIVSPERNPGLLEFDYSLNGSEGPGSFSLRLKFIETGDSFETFYMGRSIQMDLLRRLFERLEEDKIVTDSNVNLIANSAFSNSDFGWSKIYFGFGVGSDISKWSGPYVANITNVKISYDQDGLKIVELFYGVIDTFLLSNRVEYGNTIGLEHAINKYNYLQENGKNIEHEVVLDLPPGDTLDKLELVVENLTSRYLQGLEPNKNIIVVCPSLDGIKKSISSEYQAVVDYYSLANFAGINSSLDKVIRDSYKFFGRYASKNRKLTDNSLLNKPQKDMVLSDILSKTLPELGFGYGYKFTPKEMLPPVITAIPEKNVEKIPEGLVTFTTRLGCSNYTHLHENTWRVIPDFFTPLKMFSDGLKKYQGQLKSLAGYYDFALIEENDIRVLRIWEKYGIIKDSSRPAIVFAPKDFISNYLYLTDVYSKSSVLELPENSTKIEYKERALGASSIVDGQVVSQSVRILNDKVISVFGNKSYRDEFYNLFIKSNSNSSFGENTVIDELALTEGFKEFIGNDGTPIFRYNIENPNVLSMDIDLKSAALSVYNPVVTKISNNFITRNILNNFSSKLFQPIWNPLYKDNPIASPEKLIDSLVDSISKDIDSSKYKTIEDIEEAIAEKILGIISDKTPPDYRSDLEFSPQETAIKKIYEDGNLENLVKFIVIYTMLNSKTFGPKILVDQEEEVVDTQKVMFDRLHQLVSTVKLKTYPFFNLSSARVRLKKAILLNGKAVIANNRTRSRELSPVYGVYVITGFRHYISTTDAYSEFQLTKQPSTKEGVSDTVLESLKRKLSDKIENRFVKTTKTKDDPVDDIGNALGGWANWWNRLIDPGNNTDQTPAVKDSINGSIDWLKSIMK